MQVHSEILLHPPNTVLLSHHSSYSTVSPPLPLSHSLYRRYQSCRRRHRQPQPSQNYNVNTSYKLLYILYIFLSTLVKNNSDSRYIWPMGFNQPACPEPVTGQVKLLVGLEQQYIIA